MKTLIIALCLLLVVLPAGAQQIAGPPAPNFYVPYAVRDVGVSEMEPESSSDEMRIADPDQRVNAPPHPYPMHRGRHRAVQPGHGPRFQPRDSTAGAVASAVVVAILVAVLAGGDH